MKAGLQAGFPFPEDKGDEPAYRARPASEASGTSINLPVLQS